MTFQDGLRGLSAYFREHNVADPGREARLLLAYIAGVPADRMTLLAHDPLAPDVLAAAYIAADRRAKGEPLSHILKNRQFYGRDFYVDECVLDPRPETECLIAVALESGFDRLLDLGTGSGAIAVSLLAERAGATGLAVDISAAALAVAVRNAQTHGVADRLHCAEADWFDGVGGQFDLIVSNPPYIAAAEMPGLALDYEPRIALTDEGDGLSCYRKITAGIDPHLAPGGRLMVEIGPTQGAAVAAMFVAVGLQNVRILPDLDRRDRIIVGEKT